MPRVPAFGPAPSHEADDDSPRRLARVGLDSLMRDPRYFDPDHPEHGRVVDLVRRGFEIVFAAPRVQQRLTEAGTAPWRTPGINPDAPAPVTDPDGPLGQAFSHIVADPREVEDMPTARRESLGRRMILSALMREGVSLPPGFERDDTAEPLSPSDATPMRNDRPSKREKTAVAQAQESPRPTNGTPESRDRSRLSERDWNGIIDRLLEREGLFNADDPSMRGVKSTTLREVLRRKGISVSDEELRERLLALSEAEARDIYRNTIIKESQVERLSDHDLAEQVLDGIVNQGQGNGVKQLQAALNKAADANLKVDGALGSRTQAAVEQAIREGKLDAVHHQLLEERLKKIDSLQRPEEEKEALRQRARSLAPR
jgi:hypothetical protein